MFYAKLNDTISRVPPSETSLRSTAIFGKPHFTRGTSRQKACIIAHNAADSPTKIELSFNSAALCRELFECSRPGDSDREKQATRARMRARGRAMVHDSNAAAKPTRMKKKKKRRMDLQRGML